MNWITITVVAVGVLLCIFEINFHKRQQETHKRMEEQRKKFFTKTGR